MTKTPNTTRKLYNIGIVAVFFATIFATITIPEVAAQTTTPIFKLTERDYTTAATAIFGEGAGYVVVTHTGSDISDERDLFRGLNVSYLLPPVPPSTASQTKTIFIDLLETGPHTGVFVGSYLVKPTTTPCGGADVMQPLNVDLYGRIMGDGVLCRATTGMTITVKLSAPHQAVAAQTIKWFAAGTGVLEAFENVGLNVPQFINLDGWGDVIYFRVTDPDLNQVSTGAAETRSNLLRVWSDSDPVGETLLLTERTSDSAEFLANVGLEEALVANNQRVFVRGGDFVYAAYADPRDLHGVAKQIRPDPLVFPLVFVSLTNAQLSFSAPNVAGPIQADPTGSDRVTLLLFDPDRDTSIADESVSTSTLRISLFLDGNTNKVCEVAPPQVGPIPGLYMISLGFVAGATSGSCHTGAGLANPARPDLATGAILVPIVSLGGAHTILARYSDRTANDLDLDRDATLLWAPAITGTVTLGPSADVKRLVGTLDPVAIKVVDADANRNPNQIDTIQVRVRSDSDPLNGILLTVPEQTANSGSFVGAFSLTTGASSPATSTLKVADGDSIVATYDDPTSDNGRPLRVASQDVIWRVARAATVTTDNNVYFYALEAGSDVEIPDTQARIFVEDLDQNDPRVRDQVTVQAVTIQSPGVCQATPAECKTATVILDEVGVNSGLFTGMLKFTAGRASDLPGHLEITTGDNKPFRIEYPDPAAANQLPFLTPSAQLTWRHIAGDDRVVRFEFVQMEGADFTHWRPRDTIPMSSQPSGGITTVQWLVVLYGKTGLSPVVEVSSTRCPEPKTLTLDDVGLNNVGGAAGDGRYAKMVKFATLIAGDLCAPPSNPNDPGNALLSWVEIDEVGVVRPDTITLRSGPGVQSQAAVHASASDGPLTLKSFDKSRDLGVPGPSDGLGDLLPTMVEATAINDNLWRAGRDVVTVNVKSRSDPVGINVLMVEDAVNSNKYAASFLHSEAATSQANLAIKVRSGLLGDWRQNPGPDLVGVGDRLVDGVAVSGKGSDSYQWFDTVSALLAFVNDATGQIAFEATGTQTTLDLRLAPSDDVLTRRIFGETKTATTGTQSSFTLNTPYVASAGNGPGSEYVYRSAAETGPPPSAANSDNDYVVTPALDGADQDPAAEPIMDRNRDGQLTCLDITFTPPSGADTGGTNPTRCLSVGVGALGPSVGTIRYHCQRCGTGPTFGFDYRLAFDPSPTGPYEYARTNETILRVGQPIGLGETIKVDYTPAIQNVVLVSAAGETETVPVRFDPARGVYRGVIAVETVKTADNRRIFVSGTQTQITARFDDPFTETGLPAPTDANHFRARSTRITWRSGQDALVTFHTPDFSQTLLDRIFGPAIPVKVTDRDSDRTNQEDSIVVRATNVQNAGSAVCYNAVLRETGIHTGEFTGLIPPTGGSDATCTGLALASGNSVSVRYIDPFDDRGVQVPAVSSIRWQPSEDAKITIEMADGTDMVVDNVLVGPAVSFVKGTDASLTVTVKDRDANRDDGIADKVNIRVVSDGDPDGELFQLTETGFNNGIFQASAIRFEASRVANNGRVFARFDGDVQDGVRVLYTDLNMLDGRRVALSSPDINWVPTHDGVVDVEFSQFFGTGLDALDDWSFGFENLDGATNPAFGTADKPFLIPVPPGSGPFTAIPASSIRLSDTQFGTQAASGSPIARATIRIIWVAQTVGTDTCVYVKPADTAGVAVGDIRVTTCGGLLPGSRVTAAHVAEISGATPAKALALSFADRDNNRYDADDWVFADTVATPGLTAPPNGLSAFTVRLTSTGTGATLRAAGTLVQAADPDYASFGASTLALTDKPGVRGFASVALREQDCNLNPGAVDVITATTPTPDPKALCQPLSAFDVRVIGSAAPVALTKLVETGANTGVFLAKFTFTTAAAAPAGFGGFPELSVVNGDRLRASWTDNVPKAGVGTVVFVDDANWFQWGLGVLSFDRSGYNELAPKTSTKAPLLTLVDGNAKVTSTVDTVIVKVFSQEKPLGVNMTLTETSGLSGIYTARIGINTTDQTDVNSIKVRAVDQLQASYVDSSPAGTRTTSAVVNIQDRAPPITSIVTVPLEADGLRGVFKQEVTVSFTANEAVTDTFYKIGTASAFTTFENPFVLGEGVHTLTFQSEDVVGNMEALKTQVVEVDLTDPAQVVTGLTAKAISGGRVDLNWSAVATTTNPLEFFDYAVFRDGAAASIGNSTSAGFVDDTLTDENSHNYQVAVRDKSGRLGAKTAQVSVVPDKTLPALGLPVVSPTGFDTRKKPTGGVSVTVQASDKNLDKVTASIVPPSGIAIVNATLVGTSGTFTGRIDLSNVTEACTCVVRVTALDKAGNAAVANVAITITGPDSQLPQFTFGLAGNQLSLGLPLAVTVTDNVGVFSATYRLDGAPSVSVPVPVVRPVVSFEIPATLLTLGAHTIIVEAEDNATDEDGLATHNRANVTRTFTVVEGGVEPGPSGSFFLPTTVEPRSDGAMIVRWQVPSTAQGVQGFQVWRASSPFTLIGNVTNPDERTFIDTSAVSGVVYRYVVTFFTGARFTTLASVPGYPGSDEQVAASEPVSVSGGGLPSWLWILIGVFAVLAIAVLIGVSLAARRGGAQQQQLVQAPPPPPEPEMAAPEAAPVAAETHRLRCPQCSHRFEVYGTKPIVTNCPNCGRKGILR